VSETSTLTGPLRKMCEEGGALVFRMPVGKLRKGKHWIHLCPEGTADLLIFPRAGGVYWVETKDPDGITAKSRKESQDRFRQKVEALGHRYVRATTLDEGLAVLKAVAP
jgi:hypothetical protein